MDKSRGVAEQITETEEFGCQTNSEYGCKKWCGDSTGWRTEIWYENEWTIRKSKKENGKKGEMQNVPMAHPSGYYPSIRFFWVVTHTNLPIF